MESKLMKQVADHEQQWLQHTSTFLAEMGHRPNPGLTMTQLIKLVFKAEDKKALSEAQNKLLHTIQQLKETNSLNQQMIEQSLTYIDYSLDLITGAPDEDMFYKNPAKQSEKNNRRGIFDKKG